MTTPLTIELHASSAETVTGSGTGVDVTKNDAGTSGTYTRGAARLRLDVSAVSGTNPTLDVVVQTGPSSTGPWKQVGAFTRATATTWEELPVAGLLDWVRVSWTIAGTDTPTFTFAVTGAAQIVYCSPADLRLPADSAATISDATKAKHILAATGKVAAALNVANLLPLTSWGEDIRDAAAIIATVEMFDEVGWRPEADFDKRLLLRYHNVVGSIDQNEAGWLDKVATGRLLPVGLVDATPDTEEAGPVMYSTAARGW